MAYYKDNQWNLPKFEVSYNDDGQVIRRNVGSEGKGWWVELEKLWPNITNVKFKEVVATDGQATRLEKVNQAGIADGFGSSVSEYVNTGRFPDGFSHILKDIEVEEVSRSQGVDLSEREIEALYLAMQVSELELQIIELGGGI